MVRPAPAGPAHVLTPGWRTATAGVSISHQIMKTAEVAGTPVSDGLEFFSSIAVWEPAFSLRTTAYFTNALFLVFSVPARKNLKKRQGSLKGYSGLIRHCRYTSVLMLQLSG
jgi:hypothetical protein